MSVLRVVLDTNVLVSGLAYSPKSNNVAPGSASTSRSRSLPSRSVPCSTEPKTRGFAVRKRPTASRTALRFMSSATDGRIAFFLIETR
ncbi:hypothetical protein [Nitrosospira multiformis]|uniref:hypothetical protein n=1 Tax=Nitrosospira multiformis TaxID=1231 RepID=UPI00059DCEA6